MNKEEKLEALEEIKEDSKVLEFIAITMQEKDQLQSNWNSLREWLEKRKQDLDGDYDYGGNYKEDIIVLDKMNELEGNDNNE